MNIPVETAIRIRPAFVFASPVEEECIFAIPNCNRLLLPNNTEFNADYMFGSNYEQDHVFDTAVRPLLQHALTGRDVSLIAFGPSGSGKSYTMFGPGLHYTHSEASYGIIPRTFRELFIQLMTKPNLSGFLVGLTAVEIVDGQIRNLLDSTISKPPFVVRPCDNISMAMSYLHVVMMARSQAHTGTRSTDIGHCIITIHVKEYYGLTEGQRQETFYQITMVDLASTEKTIYDTIGCARRYNSGLVTMSQLASRPFLNTNQFIADPDPLFFDLLQNVFNCKVRSTVICCLSPASANYRETLDHLMVVDQIKVLGRRHADCRNESECADVFVQCPRYSTGEPESNTPTPLTPPNLLTQPTILTQPTLLIQPTLLTRQTLVNDSIVQTNVDCRTSNVNEREVNVNLREADNQDGFALQFAASQMNKLVDNAEGLIHRFAWRTDLPDDFKQQIQAWMTMKAEFESCCASTETNSGGCKSWMGLEKIEEVTESDDKNCSEDIDESSGSSYGGTSTSSSYSSRNSTGNDSSFVEVKKDEPVFKADFNDRIESLMENFQKMFDRIVETRFASVEADRNNQSSPPLPRRENNGRRKSILPGENPISINGFLKKDVTNCPLVELPDLDLPSTSQDRLDVAAVKSSAEEEDLTYNKLKLLSSGSGAKQNQLELLTLDFEGLNKRMWELRQTIEVKEQFIEEMLKYSSVRAVAKARIERKQNILESEYYKTKANLALAEKAFHELSSVTNEHKVEKYKSLATEYEKKLHDIQMINQITGESAKKVLEMESSLQSSKRKMQKLKKQAKKDTEQKLSLEQDLLEDQKKMKELEEKCKLPAKTKDSKEKQQPDVDEACLDVCTARETQLEQIMTKSLRHVGARINHLEQVMKEKSSSLDEDVDVGTKEAIRHEIRNLRRTRDCLDEQRHILVSKFNKEKVLSKCEERKFLECDEAIEAIDATIEYKNSLLICGRVIEAGTETEKQNESMLLARLSKLSLDEMKSLMCKYFRKVIDLRESGRKMESQIAELDLTTETQQRKIQTLSNALQQAYYEAERRMVVVQRNHQDKLHLMYRHFADETNELNSFSGPSEGYLRAQNRALKQRLLQTETKLLQFTGAGSVETKSPPPVTIPQENLLQLEGSSASTSRTTKVTRHKNKLIILQQKTKKPPK